MAYTKQTQQNGDTITAEKLNHMEDGIENSSSSSQNDVFYIKYNDEDSSYIVNSYEEIASKLREYGVPIMAINQSGDVANLKSIVNQFPEDWEYAYFEFGDSQWTMTVTLENGNITVE